MSNTAVTNNQGTLWDSWATKNGDYVKYCAKGPCGKKGRCLGIASGCRTDHPYIDPMDSQLERETFDIPVYCTTCGYAGNFQVHKLDLDQVNADTADTSVQSAGAQPQSIRTTWMLSIFSIIKKIKRLHLSLSDQGQRNGLPQQRHWRVSLESVQFSFLLLLFRTSIKVGELVSRYCYFWVLFVL